MGSADIQLADGSLGDLKTGDIDNLAQGPRRSTLLEEAQFLYENVMKEKEMMRMLEPNTTRRMMEAPPAEPVRQDPKIQRNAPCPCGSGKKYKKCCGVKSN